MKDRYKNMKRWGKPKHVEHILGNVEEVPKTFEIECGLCCTIVEEEADSPKKFAEMLYEWGWRITISEKYQQLGLTCRECTQEVEEEAT